MMVSTGGPIRNQGTSLIFATAWPTQCSGVLIYGLARLMERERWSTALSDTIRISVLKATQTDKHTHTDTQIHLHTRMT